MPTVAEPPSLTLRAPVDADLDVLFRLAADLDTWEERSPASPAPLTREAWDARNVHAAEDAASGGVRFVIDVAGDAVGSVSLFAADELARHAEVGIALLPEARGRGIGTLAIGRIAEFAFVRRNLRRLHLQAIASNVAAIRAYEKAGFQQVGPMRQAGYWLGQVCDEIVMDALATEFTGQSAITSTVATQDGARSGAG